MTQLLQTLFDGISVGALYASLGMALALVFRGTGVLNFAQGDIAMVTVFVFYSIFVIDGQWWFAILAAVLVGILMALMVERLVLRPLNGQPLFTVVMATIGLSTMLVGIAGIIWGHDTKALNIFEGSSELGSLVMLHSRIFAILVAVVTLVSLLAFLRLSRQGLAMRATAISGDHAQLMGIRITRSHALIWIIAALISFGAGLSIGGMQFMSTGMGAFLLLVFPALILGGLDSIGGAFIGGLTIGLITALVSTYGSYVLGDWAQGVEDSLTYVLTFLILMVRPYGLFGTKEIERV